MKKRGTRHSRPPPQTFLSLKEHSIFLFVLFCGYPCRAAKQPCMDTQAMTSWTMCLLNILCVVFLECVVLNFWETIASTYITEKACHVKAPRPKSPANCQLVPCAFVLCHFVNLNLPFCRSANCTLSQLITGKKKWNELKIKKYIHKVMKSHRQCCNLWACESWLCSCIVCISGTLEHSPSIWFFFQELWVSKSRIEWLSFCFGCVCFLFLLFDGV